MKLKNQNFEIFRKMKKLCGWKKTLPTPRKIEITASSRGHIMAIKSSNITDLKIYVNGLWRLATETWILYHFNILPTCNFLFLFWKLKFVNSKTLIWKVDPLFEKLKFQYCMQNEYDDRLEPTQNIHMHVNSKNKKTYKQE